MESAELLRQGIEAARAGRREEAREFFMRALEIEPRNEMAWMWLTGYVDDLEDKIIACENVLAINPANEKIKAYLDTLLRQKGAPARVDIRHEEVEEHVAPESKVQAPARRKSKSQELMSLAEQQEQEGQNAQALVTYERIAAQTKDSETFDFAFKQIARLEGLQQEKIRHFSPASSIVRLTFTWPLVYVAFALVQNGLNPFAQPVLYLWLGFPFVALGSFLLALSEVRIRHVIWRKIFLEEGSGSTFARIVLAVAGGVFVVVPFALMLVDSLARLQNFKIPPPPF